MRLPLALALGAAALLASAVSAKRPLPTLAHSCSQKVAATAFHVRTGDRLTLYAAVLGNGPTGIVIAAQHFSTSCEWVPEAKLLAAHGYRVLVFDYRNTGNSQSVLGSREGRIDRDVVAAARELRRRGSTQIVLVGSLIGAIAALDAAPALAPPVSAVVAIAPPNTTEPGAIRPTAAAKALQVPILVLAGNVAGVSRGSTQALYDALMSPVKQLRTVKTAAYGVDVLKDGAMNAAVLQFIAAHTK